MGRTVKALGCAAAAGLCATLAWGHETDQFTLPPGREFADLSDYFTGWAYDTIEGGVNRTNQKIEAALRENRGEYALEILQSPDEIARAVFTEFLPAYDVIEGLERLVHSDSMQDRHPGKVVGYKRQFTNIYQRVHFILDPRQFFRIWHASTFKAYGVYLGSDKIGHFTDMGMNYYKAYRGALRRGASEQAAVHAAVRVGTHGALFSERGMVGYLSAGAYSNADMAANYLGFLFYKNLTDAVHLKGELRPPMLLRDGPYWRIAPHVARDSDFFSWFFDDRYNEALNPSKFEVAMRGKVRDAVQERRAVILARYSDVHGNQRPRRYFQNLLEEFQTYYGQDYGYNGTPSDLISIGSDCFETPLPDASPDARDVNGWTPLHHAASRGDVEWLRRLLAMDGAAVDIRVHNADAYSAEWGNTPLHYAARDGRREACQFLLQRGADVNARNQRGQTPLHRALIDPELVWLLINCGADPNDADDRGRTPLHWAAIDDEAVSVERLLAAGARVDRPDALGLTPLHLAAQHGRPAAAAALLARGADVNVQDPFGASPLHAAAATRNLAMIDLLLAHSARVDLRDHFGCTALHDAARAGSVAVVHLLLSHGATVDLADAHGSTPLHVACARERPTVARTLLEAGANPAAADRSGATPLHAASAAGNRVIVELLLDCGANAMAKDNRGRTPHELASRAQHRHTATFLRLHAGRNGAPAHDAPAVNPSHAEEAMNIITKP